MDEDLRQLAILANAELGRMAKMFPLISPGRKVLDSAALKIKLYYVYGTVQKKKIILYAIGCGHRRIADIEAVTGIGRRETLKLLDSLVKNGDLVEGRELSAGKRGRPFRIFFHSEKFKSRNIRSI